MSGVILATLAALALVDSTSIGTLFIPIWLLIQPGPVVVPRYLVYLATIACFYFAVGVAIALGAGSLAGPLGDALDNDSVRYAQLTLGIALFALSFRLDSEERKERAIDRLERWRARIASTSSSPAALMSLALLAGVLELTTMLPYLGAIGLIAASDLDWLLVPVVLGGYVLVMVLPALVLLAARVVLHERVTPTLERFNRWMTPHAASATGWIVGIAGFLIAGDAASRLWGS